MTPKHLGILGGMGPVATAHFYRLVIQGALARGAKRDADFPRISLSSAVVTGFDARGFDNREAMAEELIRGAKQLAAAGADLIAMPCNTAHAFLEEVRASVSIPVLNMVEETQGEAFKAGMHKVALLSTASTAEEAVYAHPELELLALTKEEQDTVSRLIERGEEDLHDASDTALLAALVGTLRASGAEGIILGCTELSMLSLPQSEIPFFDSSSILAKAAVAACYA